MSSFTDRIVRAAKLRPDLYEEVEADTGAMGQAVAIVVLSGIAASIGAISQGGIPGLIGTLVASLLGWFLWAWITYLIGTKLFPEAGTRADMGEMLRTIGFSSSPGLIRIFGIIPGFTGLIFLISSVWMFAAMVIGVKQALDYTSTLRAIGVCLAGWLVQVLLLSAAFHLGGRTAL